MKCAFSREALALHVEGDLPAADAEIATNHLRECEDCRSFFEQLQGRQRLLKSLRRKAISPSACAGMRRQVMSVINDSQTARSGWALKIERTLLLGFRRRRYAFAALAIVAIVSVSLLAQKRHTESQTAKPVAVFEGKDTLMRPEGYREWVSVGGSVRPAGNHQFQNVYINRAAYGTYVTTGRFPEGTVMILESDLFALKASVKDSSRFAGGWGFFDFADKDGKMKAKAEALPDAGGCRSCHEERAETDHVFTQFYPGLRLTRAALERPQPAPQPVAL